PGVCCNFVSGACAITPQSACGLGAHTWTAGGSCTPFNPCAPIAACCDGAGGCRRLPRERCLSMGWTWISGSVCSPSPCPTFFAAAACRGDFNRSGAVDAADVFDFINAWLAGSSAADFDGVDGVQTEDIFAYLNAWFAGC